MSRGNRWRFGGGISLFSAIGGVSIAAITRLPAAAAVRDPVIEPCQKQQRQSDAIRDLRISRLQFSFFEADGIRPFALSEMPECRYLVLRRGHSSRSSAE